MDAVLQLRKLRESVTKDLQDGRAPFWVEHFDLSRHEYETRISQALVNKDHTGEAHFILLTRAMSDYDEHWKDRDEV